MTTEPNSTGISSEISKKNNVNIAHIEDLFYLGYATSNPITIYEDQKKNMTFVVIFRTLIPSEIRDVYEISGQYNTFGAQTVTDKLETLARAIRTINGMPLTLDKDEQEKTKKELDRDLTPLDHARIILIDKFKSPYLIDALYEAYQEFADGVKESFENIKKKLKNQTSSS